MITKLRVEVEKTVHAGVVDTREAYNIGYIQR